jgi:transcription antitermination factor NusG
VMKQLVAMGFAVLLMPCFSAAEDVIEAEVEEQIAAPEISSKLGRLKVIRDAQREMDQGASAGSLRSSPVFDSQDESSGLAVRTLQALGLGLAAFFLIFAFLRKRGLVGVGTGENSMRVVDRVRISPKSYLVKVQHGNEIHLLAVGPDHVSQVIASAEQKPMKLRKKKAETRPIPLLSSQEELRHVQHS